MVRFKASRDQVNGAMTAFMDALDLIYALFETVNPRGPDESLADYEYRLVTRPDHYPEPGSWPAWFLREDGAQGGMHAAPNLLLTPETFRTHTCLGPAHPAPCLVRHNGQVICLVSTRPGTKYSSYFTQIIWQLMCLLQMQVWWFDTIETYDDDLPVEKASSSLPCMTRDVLSACLPLPYDLVCLIYGYMGCSHYQLRVRKRGHYDAVTPYPTWRPRDQTAYHDLRRRTYTVLSVSFYAE